MDNWRLPRACPGAAGVQGAHHPPPLVPAPCQARRCVFFWHCSEAVKRGSIPKHPKLCPPCIPAQELLPGGGKSTQLYQPQATKVQVGRKERGWHTGCTRKAICPACGQTGYTGSKLPSHPDRLVCSLPGKHTYLLISRTRAPGLSLPAKAMRAPWARHAQCCRPGRVRCQTSVIGCELAATVQGSLGGCFQ